MLVHRYSCTVPLCLGSGTASVAQHLVANVFSLSDLGALFSKTSVFIACMHSSGLAAVLLVTLLSFLVSGFLIKLMGKSVTDVLTRVLGVLLATLAAQFVLDGIKGALF